MNHSAPFGIYDGAGRLLTVEEARRAVSGFTAEECRDTLRRFGAPEGNEDEHVEVLRSRCRSVLTQQYGRRALSPVHWRVLTRTAVLAAVWACVGLVLAHLPIVQFLLLLIAAPLQWLGIDLTKANADVGFTFLYVVLASKRINFILLAYYWVMSVTAIFATKLLIALADRLE